MVYTPLPPISGLEYTSIPGSGTSLTPLTLDIGTYVLNGYRFGVRYFYEVDDPTFTEGDITEETPTAPRVRTYPQWWLNSQTLAVTAVEGSPNPRQVFDTNTGSELFTVPSGGPYGPEYQYAGITNGTEYVYVNIFNELNLKYIPRLSPASQGPVDVGVTGFPNSPYDPANNVYPIDSVTACSADPRETITISYTLTTNYRLAADTNSASYSHSQVFTHVINNGLTDTSSLLKTMLQQSYYTYGIYNVGLWPVGEDPLYDEDGTPIAPVPRVNSNNGNTYNQNTNGDGFNV